MNYQKTFNALVLGAAVTATAGLAGCGVPYSEGDRVGTVTKISLKGLRDECKSWEGQLAMDNFRSVGERGTSNTFSFSVKDAAIVKQIQTAQESGERVKLHYKQTILRESLCSSDTNYTITSVTPAVKPAAPAPKL